VYKHHDGHYITGKDHPDELSAVKNMMDQKWYKNFATYIKTILLHEWEEGK
jgi:hypothetical protein